MSAYLWVTLGSAIGGLLRFALTRMMASGSSFPYGTMLVNVLGSFVIGYYGTLAVASGKYPASDNLRLFVMVGLCGGFTTFSSFSLQTFDLLRSGAWMRAAVNVAGSVLLCVGAVAAGHALAQTSSRSASVVQRADEEYTG